MTRYTAAHTLGNFKTVFQCSALKQFPADIYSEVASICRPPLALAAAEQANVKKTPTTAYIISVYKVTLNSCHAPFKPNRFLCQVFEGDDGERFERNWLYWTGNYMRTLLDCNTNANYFSG